MTIKQATEHIDALAAGNASKAEVLFWLSALDGFVGTLLGGGTAFSPYDEQTDPDTLLAIPAPFHEAYRFYLEAKLHYQNGDIARFNNANAMFLSLWQQYAAFLLRGGKTAAATRFY